MKRFFLIAAVALCSLMTSCSTYNNMVSKEEAVNAAWGNVQTQYQRRADLIPNLVNTVKGYAAHEQNTLEAVVEARAKATSINFTAEELTPEKLDEFQQAQGEVRSALGRLIAVAENYPDLKANQNFLELQAQLEGTENRIAVARTQFNNAVNAYNVSVRKFPANLVAMMFSFEQKPYFEADGASVQAPAVEF
ncbi:MAG TPA: LemA family protein [Candidatus Alistipes excrementipullorum]|nr:LemA family protein [Candidatus Alistipes excrementipullorum]